MRWLQWFRALHEWLCSLWTCYLKCNIYGSKGKQLCGLSSHLLRLCHGQRMMWLQMYWMSHKIWHGPSPNILGKWEPTLVSIAWRFGLCEACLPDTDLIARRLQRSLCCDAMRFDFDHRVMCFWICFLLQALLWQFSVMGEFAWLDKHRSKMRAWLLNSIVG